MPSRLLALALALVSAFALAGCGGGISIGLTYGFGDDLEGTPPSVSIAAPAGPVQAGQVITLVAAASDASGIDSVAFYRVDGVGTTLLGSDGSAPYEWSTVVPTDGRTTLQVFAHALDNSGQRSDSQVVSVTVVP
jgi:Bacterial Ig domain